MPADIAVLLPDDLVKDDPDKSATDLFGAIFMAIDDQMALSASNLGCEGPLVHFDDIFALYGLETPAFDSFYIRNDLGGAITHCSESRVSRDIEAIDSWTAAFRADPDRVREFYNQQSTDFEKFIEDRSGEACDFGRLPEALALELLEYAQSNTDISRKAFELRKLFRIAEPLMLLEGFAYLRAMREWLKEAERRNLGLLRLIYGAG